MKTDVLRGERVLSSLEVVGTFRQVDGLTGDSDNEMNERVCGVRCAARRRRRMCVCVCALPAGP